jgi:hypothetical protein
MATDDVTTIEYECPCGQGRLIVTQTMPDHPWVRAGQISYDAKLDCSVCASDFVVENEYGGYKPRLVKRGQFEARAAAREKARAARAQLEACAGVAATRAALVSLLDQQATKAARHRLAGKLGFYVQSYGTFLKGPTTGESIVGRSSAQGILEAGVKAGIPEAEQHKQQLDDVRKLEDEARQVQVETVKTGHNWMAA